jgi:hypothetical protein
LRIRRDRLVRARVHPLPPHQGRRVGAPPLCRQPGYLPNTHRRPIGFASPPRGRFAFSQRMRMHLVANTSPMLAMNTAYAGTKRHAIPFWEEAAVKAVPPCGHAVYTILHRRRTVFLTRGQRARKRELLQDPLLLEPDQQRYGYHTSLRRWVSVSHMGSAA